MESVDVSNVLQFVGDVTADVSFNQMAVSVSTELPINFIIIHPKTLASLLSESTGDLIIDGREDMDFEEALTGAQEMLKVNEVVKDFLDSSPEKLSGWRFSIERPVDEEEADTIEDTVSKLVQEPIRYSPGFTHEDRTSDIVTRAAAKIAVYEKFVSDLRAALNHDPA